MTFLVRKMNTYVTCMYTFAVLYIHFRLPDLEKQNIHIFSCHFCFLLSDGLRQETGSDVKLPQAKAEVRI